MDTLEYGTLFPFTDEARQVLSNSGKLLTDEVVERAVERILGTLSGKPPIALPLHESQRILEIASFGAARMILGFMKNRFVTNSFAVAESKRVSSILGKTDEETLKKVSAYFGIVVSKEGEQLSVSIPTFLMCTPRSVDYKLMNRKMSKGKVFINHHEHIRMVEEASRKYIQKIPLVKDPPDLIKNAPEKILAALPALAPKTGNWKHETLNTPGAHPPCIERLFEEIKKHENLPHQARFYLAVYLLGKGMPIDDMVNLYSNLPDFDEKITRYQIEHAQKKAYAVPACATIMTWGLCCAECKIGSPLNWKGKIWGEKKEQKGET